MNLYHSRAARVTDHPGIVALGQKDCARPAQLNAILWHALRPEMPVLSSVHFPIVIAWRDGDDRPARKE